MIKSWLGSIAGILILAAMTYGTVVYLNSQRVGAPQFGPEPATSPYLFWLRLVGLIVVTFIGIVSSYLFEQVRGVRGPVNLPLLLRRMWTSPRFVMALIVSPLVFNAIYLVIGDLPRSVADYYLAFQNGFGWERIINGLGSVTGGSAQELEAVGN